MKKITIEVTDAVFDVYQHTMGNRYDTARAIQNAVIDRAKLILRAERHLNILNLIIDGVHSGPRPPEAVAALTEAKFFEEAQRQNAALLTGRY